MVWSWESGDDTPAERTGTPWSRWRLVLGGGALVAVLGIAYSGWQLVANPSMAESVAAEAQHARGSHPRGGMPPEGDGAEVPARRMVLVHVVGAVAHPGLYRLGADLRVVDALVEAGGALPDADPDRMPNLAARLADGKQVRVPRLTRGRSNAAGLDVVGDPATGRTGPATGGKRHGEAGSTGSPDRPGTRLDVNSASEQQLAGLPGMDPALARAIVDFRDQFGTITNLGQLRRGLTLDAPTMSFLRTRLKVVR